MLPVVHGWEFIERYHAVTHGQDIPIVVVSAAGAVTRSMEALGVRRFLPKPIQVADLVDAIEDVLSGFCSYTLPSPSAGDDLHLVQQAGAQSPLLCDADGGLSQRGSISTRSGPYCICVTWGGAGASRVSTSQCDSEGFVPLPLGVAPVLCPNRGGGAAGRLPPRRRRRGAAPARDAASPGLLLRTQPRTDRTDRCSREGAPTSARTI
jgi:hypothetical protein